MTALHVLGLLAALVATGGLVRHGVTLLAPASTGLSVRRQVGPPWRSVASPLGGDSGLGLVGGLIGGGCGGDTRSLRATGFVSAV